MVLMCGVSVIILYSVYHVVFMCGVFLCFFLCGFCV